MKAKNKIKNILACIALVFALLFSCSYQTLWVASNYASSASAKSYVAENKTDPYEFESAGKWSRSTNYSSVQVDGNTINAFDKTTVSQNLATLVKDGKPSTLWNGDSTTVAEGEDSNLDKYKVMMIEANSADTKQEKEVKDDDDNYVFKTDNEGNFIYETDENGTVYYDSANINTSDSKFVPVDETQDPDHAGKYKAKVIKKEPTDIYYYYKSNSVSLSKQAYYVASFWVYTVGDAYASISIANSAETFNAKVENIKSDNKWTKIYMFMETRADGSASTVYISLYFGSTESINGANDEQEKVTGTVYFDTLELKTINYTDYVNKTIDGVAPSEENKEIADSYSNRYNYDLVSNPSFDGEDLLDSEWTNYIPEYIDGSTDDKISSTTREKYEQAYSNYSNISIVKESEELKHYDTDDEGNKKYEEGDTDKKNPLMKDGYSTFSTNNTVLKIDNDSQLYSIGKTSAPFTINRFMYYRVSVWVKGADKNSSATVKLYGKVITGNKSEGLLISQSQTVSDLYTDPEDLIVKPSTDEDDSDDTMDYNNGWTEVVFYVHGNAYNDIDIQIALLADKNSTVYYDNIRIESVLSTEYSSATSSKKLELTFSPSKSSSEQYLATSITNGYFENITTEEYDHNDTEAYTAPYIAASWTLDSDNSKDVVAGVVPTGTNYTQAIKEKLGGASDPNGTPYENGVVPAANNVYAIYAPKTVDEKEVTHDYSITSSSFSLSSVSVYKVSFMMKYTSGTDSNFEGKIKAYLTYSSNTIAEQSFDIQSASTGKDTWYTVSFLVRTGSSARSTTITLSVEDAVGTVFFKNVGIYKYAEATRTDETGKEIKVSTDKQFEELYEKYASISSQKANNISIVDYNSYNFTMHSTNKVEIPSTDEDENENPIVTDYYESFSHFVEENSDDDDSKTKNTVNGIVGVVDTTEDELTLSDTVKVTNLKNNNSLSDTALVIYNETELYTTVSPRVTHTLSANSFYTIELYVRTSEFAEGKGLSINMGAISVYFDDVDTTENADNNGYTLYRAIVRTGSSSITGLSINFELGTENDKLSGYALISDINVTKLADIEEYNKIVDEVDDNDKNTVIKNFYVEENSGDTNSTPVENQTLINFFLVFSTILMVLAIVIALVAFYIKKHPQKKKVKVDAKDSNKYKSAKTKEEKEINDKGGFV